MQVTLTNAELLALRDIAEETQNRYGQMVADLEKDLRPHKYKWTMQGVREPELYKVIQEYETEINECQLTRAIFTELWVYLQGRAYMHKAKYSVKLTPTWCLAIRLEFNGMIPISTLLGNTMQRICDKTHQTFQS